MEVQYFAVGQENALDLIAVYEVRGAFADLRMEVERRFEEVIAAIEARQVLVFCAELGPRPGCFVAAEAVYVAHLTGKVKPEQQARSLIWLVDENVPRH